MGKPYDALYGTDVIDEAKGKERSGGYNLVRGAAVVDYVADMLDDALPLANGSHADVTWYAIEDGGLITNQGGLRDASQFVGYIG